MSRKGDEARYRRFTCEFCGKRVRHKSHYFYCPANPNRKPTETQTPTQWTQQTETQTQPTETQPIQEPQPQQTQEEVVIQKPQPSKITVIPTEEVEEKAFVQPIALPTEQPTEPATEKAGEEETETVCSACGQPLKIPKRWSRELIDVLIKMPYDVASMIVHPCLALSDKEARIIVSPLKIMLDERFPITKETKADIWAVVGAFSSVTAMKYMQYRKIKAEEREKEKVLKTTQEGITSNVPVQNN